MRRFNNILIIALGVLLLSSCSKESISSGDGSLPSGAATIAIALPEATVSSRASLPEAGVGSENYIKELKLFIFDALTGALDKVISIDPAQSVVGNDSWDNTSRTLTMRDFSEPTRLRTVYAIANWAITDSELAAITNVTKLEASLTELTGQVVAPTEALPLLMSGKAASWDFSKAKALTVKVKRQVVKIELTVALGAKFVAAFPDHTFGPSDVELRNAPKLSYVCEQTAPALPLGNTLFRYTPQEMTANTTTKEWTTTLYAYENPTTGVDAPQATYFILHLPYTDKLGTLTDKNFYKLTIENVDDALNPHRTLRNTLYRMKVRVEGFGSEFPDQNSVSITTEVLPWDAEDITSSDGEFLKVSHTSVRLKHTIANDKLVVKSHDPEHTTVTAVGGKINVAYNPTTGIVTLNKAAYDPAIKELISAYETITITVGSLTKTVKVEYEPIVWARGDIALNADPKGSYYINGWGGHGQSLLFMFGSKVGLASTHGYPVDWNTTLPFYTPGNSSADAVATNVGRNLAEIKAYSAAVKGDPCAYVSDENRKWRLPTSEEFGYLFASPPIAGSDSFGGGSFSGYRFNAFKIENSPGVYEGIFMYNYYMQRDYYGALTLTGYYWSSTPAPSGTGGGYSLICNNSLGAGARINVDDWSIQAAVRCVRDFR